MSKLNKIIGWAVYNFFKKGFEENGHSITLIVDEKSAYKYSLNRDYCFLWKQFSERIDIFLSKKDLDRKLKYMNITAKNYNRYYM